MKNASRQYRSAYFNIVASVKMITVSIVCANHAVSVVWYVCNITFIFHFIALLDTFFSQVIKLMFGYSQPYLNILFAHISFILYIIFKQKRKEMFYLMTHSTHFIYRLYGWCWSNKKRKAPSYQYFQYAVERNVAPW